MSDFMFENLEVYQKSVNFADEVSDIIEKLERGYYHIRDQFGRASLSISLNIAEGNGKWHIADRKKYFLTARGSAFECVPLLEICKRRKIITEEQHDSLKQKIKSISMMLSKLISGTDNRESD
jgi:four helix bundle protein